MPYYTFNVYSHNKNVLTKQFTTQDCFDVHFLLANNDYEGIDLFCQQKFEEYSNSKLKLNCLDKFLFLFSQKIISHNFDINLSHSIPGVEKKTTIVTSLVKIYNTISDSKFTLCKKFTEGNVEIEYGIPYSIASNRDYCFYKINVNSKEYRDLEQYDTDTMSFLPVKLYRELIKMQQENNKIIESTYFKNCFLTDLKFSNECFLYLLNFIYTENVGDYFSLCYNLSKDYGVDYNHIKSITMRELYLLVDTINKIVQEKNKKNK